jgi:hypothetical protein
MITELFKKVKTLVVDNSSLILTYLSVSGVVATSVLAVKATPKALEKLSQLQWELHQHEDRGATNKEIVELLWKDYLPAVTSGAFTIACIVGAQSINVKKNAALVSVYSLTESALKEYQAKVKELHGENKERKVREEITKDRMTSDSVIGSNVFITGLGEQLCYDSFTGRYFKSDIETIRKAQNDINSKVINHMYASHNEFYALIGLSATGLGEEVGWTSDYQMDIEFTSHLAENGVPCLCLEYRTEPKNGYHKLK